MDVSIITHGTISQKQVSSLVKLNKSFSAISTYVQHFNK